MACVQWVYANGSCWVPLDKIAQGDIEILWSRNASYWIRCPSLSMTGSVYVDISEMVMLFDGYAYAIARSIL